MAAPIAIQLATGANRIPVSGRRNGRWLPEFNTAKETETIDKIAAREAQINREFFDTKGATSRGTYSNTMSPPSAAGPIPKRKTSHNPRFSGV